MAFSHVSSMADLRDHKFIICGGDGLNPLGIVRSLGKEGIYSYVISKKSKGGRPLIATSRFVTQVLYAETEEDVIDILVDVFGGESNKPFVFLTDEGHAELLDRRYNDIKGKFYFFDAGRKGRLTELNDKSVQCRLASSCGFTVPRFEVLEKGSLPVALDYPVITKTLSPNEGQWKKDMFVCHDESALLCAFEKIEASRLIIEEYIEGIHEYDLKGISIDGGREVCFTYAKIWNSQTDSFSSIMHYEPCDDTVLKERIQALMKKADYSGIFDIEFIQDASGELYFLEVNWRTGMYNFNHTVNGFNIPYLWAKFSLTGHIDTSSIVPKYGSYTSFDELVAFSACLRKPKLFGAWIRTIWRSDILFYYDRNDLKPCLFAWLYFFKRKTQLFINRFKR